ncbi:qor [Lepeophtheirus salmonis]|uniref:Qor n=2 Tax=Lepeophtheirus salmonis TaxID=72036 RepID=D3PHP1_LEPSM|nr:quinone oxidoreductase-like [Lepeophtheirus salmonis]ADD38077.1 Quinone oxidoreductase [Lepeophtheirus salmonis]CAB4059298.1 qor [Lepeophtheirus salmonis]CAF2847054.1 qor [Lepeophtheirus salmonis]
MRAVRVHHFGSPEVLSVENGVVLPPLNSGEVLVRVIYSGVNPVETYIREGQYSKLPELPYTPGSDAAGYIEALGPNIPHEDSDLCVGERVFVTGRNSGSYAEFIITESVYVFKLHQRLSLAQGAALGVPYFTAYKALIMGAKARPGEKVLIHGASGAVGTAAVQIARALGVVVVGTAGTKDGMDVVSACGAHHVFNHNHKSYEKKMIHHIGGDGFDVIIEHLANINLGHDLQMLKEGARIMVVGCRGSVEINPRYLMLLEASVKGVSLGISSPSEWREIGAAIVAGIESGWVNPVINKVYLMDQVQNVHYDIIHSKGAKGKLVLKVADDFEEQQEIHVQELQNGMMHHRIE